jgi:hypothetical protein
MRRLVAISLALVLGAALSRASRGDDAPDELKLATEIRAATSRATKAIAAAMSSAPGTPFPSAFGFVRKNDQVRTLAALALVRAGNAEEKKVARALIDSWWEEAASGTSLTSTGNYELALGISALEGLTLERVEEAHPTTVSRYEAQPMSVTDKQRLEDATRALIEGRSSTYEGGCAWSYAASPITSETSTTTRPDPLRTRANRFARRAAGAFDNSNTQFSVLALHDAARGGVVIPPEIANGIAAHFLACGGSYGVLPGRTATGGGALRWGYNGSPEADGTAFRTPTQEQRRATMNFAGLSSLAIARDLGAKDAQVTRAIERGLEGISEFVTCFHGKVPTYGEGGGGTAYALYSLEKAFDSLELKAIGGSDWFSPLAREVLRTQETTGLWGSGDVIDSCLYVLFLTRATVSRGRVTDRRSTGALASKSSLGEVFLPRNKKTVNAIALVSDYGMEPGPARRLAADEAVHALAAEGHGRDACLVGPLAALLEHKGPRSEDGARWLHDVCGRAVTPDQAKAAGARFDPIAESRDPALLRAVLLETKGGPNVLPLRAFAASALATAPGADANDLCAAAEALAGEPALATLAGARCARAYADALTGLLCAELPALPQEKLVTEPDLRSVVKEARVKMRKALDAEIDRGLAAYAKRADDAPAWRAQRAKLNARGKVVLAEVVSIAEDPRRSAQAFTLLRALTGELIPDDLASWKVYLDSRP